MQPSRRLCIYASFALLTLCVAPRTLAKNLTINSTPPGARVEINGLFAGRTPYTSDYPGGYFHKPHTVFGARLDHAMVLTVSKDGYLSEKLTLTKGPFTWVSINGRHRGHYFLLKSTHFDVRLEPVPSTDTYPSETIDGEGPMRSANAKDLSKPSGRRASTGTVAISSNPAHAEIYVDGQFEGQTPCTLRLLIGLHHFVVKFPSENRWERNMDVLAGSKLTLSASPKSSP
jgi:hypothetical protein